MAKKNSEKKAASLSLKNLFAVISTGYVSGFPFNITRDIVKGWLTEVGGASNATIGMFSWVATPYSLKFLWSPLLDRYPLPFLGRRRGWILVFQALMFLAIILLGQLDAGSEVQTIAAVCVVIAFFSASQDIVLDAYRRELLTDEEVPVAMGYFTPAWRIGQYSAVGIAALNKVIGWEMVFLYLALVMIAGMVCTFLSQEPKDQAPQPKNLMDSVVQPLLDFFRRKGSLIILVFLLLYKLGDNMASAMVVKFVNDLGFESQEYFLIVKAFGSGCYFIGALAGGFCMQYVSRNRALWIFGILQMISTAGYVWLRSQGHSYPSLISVVVFENLTSGMGQTALAAYVVLLTSKQFTATQYALLSSLVAVPGSIVAGFTGFIVDVTGWDGFFWICAFIALPGMGLLFKLAPWNKEATVGIR